MKKKSKRQQISEAEAQAEDIEQQIAYAPHTPEHIFGDCGSLEAETARLRRARQRVRQRRKNLAKKK